MTRASRKFISGGYAAVSAEVHRPAYLVPPAERSQGGRDSRSGQQSGVFLRACTEGALRKRDEGARVGGAERCDLWEEPNGGMTFVKEQRRVERPAICRVFQDVVRPRVACRA
eukprot:6175887-Pleurochrysis_carterae.AAC.1